MELTAKESIRRDLTNMFEEKDLGDGRMRVPYDLDGKVIPFIAPPDGSLKEGETLLFDGGYWRAEVSSVGTTVEQGRISYILHVTSYK